VPICEDTRYDLSGARDVALRVLLIELGRLYLPWVSRACRDGQADLVFASGTRVALRATEFLRDARATLLARYAALRCGRLDTVLEATGILPFFADYMADAGALPEERDPPRPTLNRPYPPAGE
jgi:hypothetical protein